MRNKRKVYLLLCIILLGCNSKIKKNEKEYVLMPVTNHNIETEESRMIEAALMLIINHFAIAEEDRMLELDSLFSADIGPPVRFEITQRKDYKDFFSFYISTSNSNIFFSGRLPTKIIKTGNRDVYMYMNEAAPLSKKELPDDFFKEVDGIALLDESPWNMFLSVLMCKKCLKSVVVIDRFVVTEENTKQFNEFTCDCEHDYKKENQKIIIEKAIITDEKGEIRP